MAGGLTNVNIKRDDERWEVEVKAEIPANVLLQYRAEALEEIRANAKLDGFRPGKAPAERILAIYGEGAILKHAAEHAIQHELPELLASEKLLIIESPRVSVDLSGATKSLAFSDFAGDEGRSKEVEETVVSSGRRAGRSPLRTEDSQSEAVSFTARAALAPNVELPDYKTLASKHPKESGAIEASDKEHIEALTYLRRERARIEKVESGGAPEKAAEESRAMEEKDLPPLDDAFVQSLGYENAEKFSAALRTNIKTEKERQVKERRRAAILDELAKESKISYPATLREYELTDMEERLRDDLSRMGRTYEEYLTEIKKTKEELRANWKDAADKRAKIRLILTEIARKEHIDADPEELERELEHAKKRYPSAPPETLRANLAHVMRNEAVLKWS